MATEITHLLSGFKIKCFDGTTETTGIVLGIKRNPSVYGLSIMYRRDDNGRLSYVRLKCPTQLGYLVLGCEVKTKLCTISLNRTYPLENLWNWQYDSTINK